MNKLSLFLLFLFSTIQIFAQNNIPSYVPTNGLVGWWPFNGNANDESGNGNNGTVNGATLTTDRFGNNGRSYSFDGVNDFIGIPSIINSPTFTISLWYYTTIVPSLGQQLMYYQGTREIQISRNELFIGAGVKLSNDNYYFTPANSVATSIVTNNWQHLVATYIRGDKLRFYINGTNVDSSEISPNLDFWIGGNNNASFGAYNQSGLFYDGTLDDIAIYNRALTPQEITALYTGQITSNTNTDTTANTIKPVPPGIPYQAVIRNASGQIMTNANVTAQFTLHKDSALGAVEYQEVHALTTNGHGLINTVLGKGTATQGTFASINWANTNKFLQVRMDLGNGYVDLGTQQLMSVPYAMYAANGPKGEKGDKGDSGVAGPQGLQGVQGPPGNGFQNGTVNGQMMYWKDSVWVTVSPGTNGQTLTLCNGLPHWGPCPVDTIIPTQITIGSQIWDNKNLDVSTYRNGDPIPQVTDTIQWANLTTGAWCWYNNDSANYWQYGKLYNWFAVNDPRGLAPIGWHVPTDAEWNKLVKFLEPSADTTLSGWQNTTIGGMLKSTTLWNSPNTGATNSSGFGALAGGRRFSSGYFSNVGNFGYWWTSTENNASFAWYRYLSYTNSDIHRFNFNKVVGFSVRLIKD